MPPRKKKAAKESDLEKDSGENDKKVVLLRDDGFKFAEEADDVPIALRRPDFGFDYLDDDKDVSASIEESLISVVGRRSNQTVSFNKMSEVRQAMLPVKPFLMQYAMGIYGIPKGCLIEIIGAEGLGKSSLSLQMLGWAMDLGCPALYIECENKQLPPARALRCLHTNPMRAMKMLNRLRKEKAHSLQEMDQKIIDYVSVARGKVASNAKKPKDTVPIHVPIVIVVDPWSKLLNPEEASGFYEYGDNMKKGNKLKKTGETGNFGHAKWAAAWCRRLPTLLDQENVILIVVHHQMDNVSEAMKASHAYATGNLPDWVGQLNNKTKIGGRASNQNAAVQLTLALKGMVYDDNKKPVGKEVYCSVIKNSFGPEKRRFYYTLRSEGLAELDTLEHLEPAISFDDATAKAFVDNGWLGTKATAGKYTCDVLGVKAALPEDFMRSFEARNDVKQMLGQVLRIEGYIDTVDTIKKMLEERADEKIDEKELRDSSDNEARPVGASNDAPDSDVKCDD